jgi:hypothetical protein
MVCLRKEERRKEERREDEKRRNVMIRENGGDEKREVGSL